MSRDSLQWALRLLVVGWIAGLLGCRATTRHTPDDIRKAVEDSGVLGAQPADAIRRLQSIRLADGRGLEVGSYLADRSVIEATVTDAKRTWSTTWSVNIIVHFDSLGRAATLDVHYSAKNPPP